MQCSRSTSVFLLQAKLSLQGLPELPLSDQLHLQLRPLQLVLLLLRPCVLYGNPQQTLLGDTQAHINRLYAELKPGGMRSLTSPNRLILSKYFCCSWHFNKGSVMLNFQG